MKFSFANMSKVIEIVEELAVGLVSLSFDDNFKSFTAQDVNIKAGKVARITNDLKTIPSKYVIVDQTGASIVTRSKEDVWTTENVYIKNNGSEDVTVDIVFME